MKQTIIIKQRSINSFDVFFGNTQWNEHAYFRMKNNRLILESGQPVPQHLYTEITKEIQQLQQTS